VVGVLSRFDESRFVRIQRRGTVVEGTLPVAGLSKKKNFPVAADFSRRDAFGNVCENIAETQPVPKG
jgi:hypothetical protein